MMVKTTNSVIKSADNYSGSYAGSTVQKKAYELYIRRGKRAGHAIDDWLEAERLIRQKALSR